MGLPDGYYYVAFRELKTEKHPVPKRIQLSARLLGVVSAQTTFWVMPVFDHLAHPIFGWPEDREEAWRYAKWKYDVLTSSLTSISYAPGQTEAGLTSTLTDACTLGPDAFSSENSCAGTLAHENVHGIQTADYIFSSQASWAAGFSKFAEVDAYNVEIQKAGHHGYSPEEIAHATAWRDYYDRKGPKPD